MLKEEKGIAEKLNALFSLVFSMLNEGQIFVELTFSGKESEEFNKKIANH